MRLQTETTSGAIDKAPINATIYRPDGAGPFPAVIILHDCGGVNSKDQAWAKRLTTWGYVAVIVDSFSTRGTVNRCLEAESVPPRQRARDAIAAAKYLQTQPYIQANKLGVLGFSHGGYSIMAGVQAETRWADYGIRGAVAYYPPCRLDGKVQAARYVALPVKILIGEKDDWTLASECVEISRTAIDPSLVQLTVYPGVYHSFDCNCGTKWVQGIGQGRVTTRRIEGDSAATRDAEAQTRAFFDQLLKGR
ncbi:MAG: dienelactone hydrolase family protein [Proteobacteria bacterium]|nr:dienelactone hydrolase family protein [Pseudomonadota bacterium]